MRDISSAVEAQAYECRSAPCGSDPLESARQSEKSEIDPSGSVHTANDTAKIALGARVLRMLEHPNSYVKPSKLGNWFTAYDGESCIDAVGPTALDALTNLFTEMDARAVV